MLFVICTASLSIINIVPLDSRVNASSNIGLVDRYVTDENNKASSDMPLVGLSKHLDKPNQQKSENTQPSHDVDAHNVLSRASASYFQAQPQVMPDYVLEVEFFPIGLLSAIYGKESNPDKAVKWFESQQSSKPSSRLSLWKDGNQLYSQQISFLS